MSTFHDRTRPKPPVRMVHLGLGNFYRAHQAWYTHHASDAADWGYAAFEGRSARISTTLNAQDSVYTLASAASDGDRYELIESISRAHSGKDHRAWIDYCASPEVAIISTTVTEAGYLSDHQGGVLLEDPTLCADLETLRAGGFEVVSAPARVVAGLIARRAADSGAVTLMSCDNLLENGTVLRQVTMATASLVDPSLLPWIEENVSFVTTMVDRITPRPTDEDLKRVEAGTGIPDAMAVITEPFSEWVIDGEFPAGRPDWASAGATFTADIAAHERRKLWLLNGGHSLLAYVGLMRGRVTVAEAMADEYCRATLNAWWDTALGLLQGDGQSLRDYTSALCERFENPRIRHRLAQIAADGSMKIPVRWLPGLGILRDRGEISEALVRGLAAYTTYLQRGDVDDVAEASLLAAVGPDARSTLRGMLAVVAPGLLDDSELLAAIDARLTEYAGESRLAV